MHEFSILPHIFFIPLSVFSALRHKESTLCLGANGANLVLSSDCSLLFKRTPAGRILTNDSRCAVKGPSTSNSDLTLVDSSSGSCTEWNFPSDLSVRPKSHASSCWRLGSTAEVGTQLRVGPSGGPCTAPEVIFQQEVEIAAGMQIYESIPQESIHFHRVMGWGSQLRTPVLLRFVQDSQ
jgi:hypothetical protein